MFEEAGLGELVPFEPEWARAVYHLYVVRVSDRGGFMRQMAEAGIGTAIHYPVPLHLQKAYEGLGYKAGAFAVAEKVAPEIVSLPIFPDLTASEQAQVASPLIGSMCNAEVGQAS